MLTLPSPARRAHLRAFSVAIGLSSGVALGCLLALRLSVWWIGLGLCLGLIAAAVGLRWPQSMRGAYVTWGRLSGLYMRVIRVTMKAICFLILTILSRRAGSPLNLAHPGAAGSFWAVRDDADHHTASDATRPGWCYSYVSWARRSGKWWALSLLPFLVVLASVDTETEVTLPSETYTLF